MGRLVRFVRQEWQIEFATPDMLEAIERVGRTCYRSELKAAENTAPKFVRMLISRGHESPLEFAQIVVRIVCDRGISHQLVRHRLASYAQESTRYCNYASERFGCQVTLIEPTHWPQKMLGFYMPAAEAAAQGYLTAIDAGVPAEIARDLLPTATATQIVMECNVRQWRHVFRERTVKAAHPRMRDLMRPMLREFRDRFPVVFDDVGIPDCCPVCRAYVDYDADTWGNYYVGPKCPLKYVCPNCVGKGGSGK